MCLYIYIYINAYTLDGPMEVGDYSSLSTLANLNGSTEGQCSLYIIYIKALHMYNIHVQYLTIYIFTSNTLKYKHMIYL